MGIHMKKRHGLVMIAGAVVFCTLLFLAGYGMTAEYGTGPSRRPTELLIVRGLGWGEGRLAYRQANVGDFG